MEAGALVRLRARVRFTRAYQLVLLADLVRASVAELSAVAGHVPRIARLAYGSWLETSTRAADAQQKHQPFHSVTLENPLGPMYICDVVPVALWIVTMTIPLGSSTMRVTKPSPITPRAASFDPTISCDWPSS